MMRKIESLRIDKGVTAEEMAKDFGVTVKTIYNWQDNQRALTGEKIIKICKYFGITANDFLGIDIKEKVG